MVLYIINVKLACAFFPSAHSYLRQHACFQRYMIKPAHSKKRSTRSCSNNEHPHRSSAIMSIPTAAQGTVRNAAWVALEADNSVKSKDDINGMFVVCLPCTMKLSASGSMMFSVKMRHAFRISAWAEHCNTGGHRLNYSTYISKNTGQSSMTAFFSKKREGEPILPVPSRPACILSCSGVIMKYSSKAVAPLLDNWEKYGVPGANYKLGYCGIDLHPQILASKCEGAKATKGPDVALRPL